MAGELHVETVAYTDGRLRVYLSDLRRRDVSPAGVTGSVAVSLLAGRVLLSLAEVDGHLEAHGPPIPAGDVAVDVMLLREARSIELHVVVPAGIPPGLAGLPRACTPPVDAARDAAIAPRCVVDFPRMVRALATLRDPAMLLVAVFGHGVTLWRLPEAEATAALEPVPGGDAHPEHAHPVDALAIRPDGREVAVAVERAILRYALPGGTVVRELPRDHHLVRALAYAADGRGLLVSTLVDGGAELIDADDGREIARFAIERPLSAAAFAADGSLVVLAIPDNFADVYELPDEVLTRLRQLLAGNLPVRLEGPSQVALFLYDNGALVVESFRSEAARVRLVFSGKTREICDLMAYRTFSLRQESEQESETSGAFEFSLAPHSYRVFAAS